MTRTHASSHRDGQTMHVIKSTSQCNVCAGACVVCQCLIIRHICRVPVVIASERSMHAALARKSPMIHPHHRRLAGGRARRNWPAMKAALAPLFAATRRPGRRRRQRFVSSH